MRIKIEESKRAEIVAAFKEANGKATTNALHGDRAFDIAKEAAAFLVERGVPVSSQRGATVSYTPSGPPLSYGYGMRTTSFTLYRGRDDWFLVGVEAVTVRPKSSGGMTVSIVPYQAEIITTKALKGLVVQRAA